MCGFCYMEQGSSGTYNSSCVPLNPDNAQVKRKMRVGNLKNIILQKLFCEIRDVFCCIAFKKRRLWSNSIAS